MTPEISPLTLPRATAAALCGLTPSGFDRWVRCGIVPGPLPGTRRWSRVALERALNADVGPNHTEVSNEPEDLNAEYERWKANHQ